MKTYQTHCISSCPTDTWISFTNPALCVDSCNFDEYQDITTNSCKKCHPSCLTCEGSSASDCKTCQLPSFLYQKTCITNCPIPLWRASSSLLCGTSCQISQYGDLIDRICKDCDASCNSCRNIGPTNCLTCFDGWYLLNGACFSTCPSPFWAINQRCVSDCGAGKFGDHSDRKCKSCDSNCNTCVGATSADCSSCNVYFFLENSQCVNSCKSGFFGNVISYNCEKCDSSCLSCRGATSYDCLSCVDSKKYLENFICGVKCSENLFERDDTKTCEACIMPNCLQCNIKWNKCKKCDDDNVLFSNGSCIKKVYLYPTLIKYGEKNEFNLSSDYSIALSENDLKKFLTIFIETPIKYNYTLVKINDSLISLSFTFFSNITKETEFLIQLNQVFLQSKLPHYILNETNLQNNLSSLLRCPTEYIPQGKNKFNFLKFKFNFFKLYLLFFF